MMFTRRSLLLAGLFLSGCSWLKPNPDEPVRRLTGQFLLKDARTNQRLSARYRIEQSPDKIRLDILGPLNAVLARLESDESGITYTEAGKAPVTEHDVDAFMNRTLGFSVSLPCLLDWLFGEPDSTIPFKFIEKDVFEQSGWRIRILERAEQNNRVRRLQLEKATTSILLTVSDP